MRDAPAEDPGLLVLIGTTLRLMLGWGSAGLGLLNLAMGFDVDTDGSYLVFHLVLVLAGVVLMGWSQLPARPGRIAVAAGGTVTVVGLAVSLLTEFPFPQLVADLVFWVYAGFLTLTAAAVVRGVRQPAPGTGEQTPPSSATGLHAEPRGTDTTVAQDENVGGLP